MTTKLEHDPVSKAIRWVEHNWTTITGVALMGGVLWLSGCSALRGQAVDPTTNTMATAQDILVNASAEAKANEKRIRSINSQITMLANEADQIKIENDDLVDEANNAITRANAITERNIGWITSTFEAAQSFVPGSEQVISMLGGTALLASVFNGIRVDRKVKKSIAA